MPRQIAQTFVAALMCTLLTSVVWADISVGVAVSATGQAASLGIPEKNTIDLLPSVIGGHKVNYNVLDDVTDTTTAVKNIKKLITESKVDVVIGSTTAFNSLAMIDVAADSETPMLTVKAWFKESGPKVVRGG